MDNRGYNRLDLKKIREKKSIIVSSQDALKDVIPINWSQDILSGKRKVQVGYNK